MYSVQLTEVLNDELPIEIREYVDVFKYKDIANLRRPLGAEHAIDLELG